MPKIFDLNTPESYVKKVVWGSTLTAFLASWVLAHLVPTLLQVAFFTFALGYSVYVIYGLVKSETPTVFHGDYLVLSIISSGFLGQALVVDTLIIHSTPVSWWQIIVGILFVILASLGCLDAWRREKRAIELDRDREVDRNLEKAILLAKECEAKLKESEKSD